MTTWAAPNWPPTCSARRKPRKSCAGRAFRARNRRTTPTMRWAQRCGKPSRTLAAPCPKSCPRRTRASSRSNASSVGCKTTRTSPHRKISDPTAGHFYSHAPDLVTFGTKGDCRPMVALALGLAIARFCGRQGA
ncbi:hypothetical protein CBM2637_A20020 [Cupriavidus taiwanensis]|nr:hypothetical protein CBM2637_A20020 [Cupriavidus taiwanensis]